MSPPRCSSGSDRPQGLFSGSLTAAQLWGALPPAEDGADEQEGLS